jgi:glutathione S-transferase
MPRPDLELIGVGYRKIPLMAVGSDVYCDSRCIISKLESLYPDSALSPSTPAEIGIRKLFESWTIDGGIFANAVKMMPYWHEASFLSNEAFVDDRQKLMGGKRFTAEAMESGRPDGAQNLQQAFDMLETTFLADGRDWILNTQEPSLADIDAVWPFKWLMSDRNMKDSLPAEHFNANKYPKVFAWVERFVMELDKKKTSLPKPSALDGKAMCKRTLEAATLPEAVAFTSPNSHGLEQGDEVEIFPSDYGQMGKTAGTLVGLTVHEVVVCNSKGIHVHFPRWNFTISRAASKSRI